MPINGDRAILLIGVFIAASGLAGCGVSSSPSGGASGAEAGGFLGISISEFSDARPLPVYADAVTSQSTRVTFPEDLFETVPLEAVMVLPAPGVTIVDDGAGEAGQASPAAHLGERRVGIIFRVAPNGSDACASAAQIGPFEMSVVNGVVTLASESRPLTAHARSVVHTGRFEICAQVQGDFGGSVVVGTFRLEFGKLRSQETRIELCHIPPGNPENRHTITVGASSAEVHLAHGDYLGECEAGTDDGDDDDDDDDDGDDDDSDDDDDDDDDDSDDDDDGDHDDDEDGDDDDGDGDDDGDNDDDDDNGDDGDDDDDDGDDDNGDDDEQADADADGVADGADLCPNTPTGETPDSNGCSCSQLDGDGDGVDDCGDLCPATPAASDVDADGCPASDGDGDGVTDGTDACPSTPLGDAVDESGCSCSQLDGDGDGVTDCDDLCPTTPVDVPVDGFGCEIALVDAGPDVTLDEAGVVTLQGSASGGTPPYSYSWSAPGWDGVMEQVPTVLVAETTTYTLTVTDWSFPPLTVTDTVTITVRSHDDLQYTIVNLGSLSSNASYPSGINESGQVVGYSYTDSWQKRAFLYSEGEMVDLGTLGGSEAHAYDINNAGQVVGEARTAAGDWHAFLWEAGSGMQDLGTLGGSASVAYAINELGQAVGYSSIDSANHAFLYSDGVMSDLGTFDYHQSAAFDINDQSQIVGLLLPLTSTASAFIYDAGTLIDLGSPLLASSQAWLINNSGLLAGHSWEATAFRSFIYGTGTAIDLGTLDGFSNSYVWGISEPGQVVGNVTNATGTLSHAFVYAGGVLYNLNDLIAPGHGWDYLTAANAVNSAGQITGYGRINDEYRGFLMTPLP
ncbi:MAG: hypothetical protein GY778_10530 [bacterium]|nr:hypothetical protein [bacterium]